MSPSALERRRAQNLAAPRPDARAVTPSIRNFAQAIDRQRQGLERIPLLQAARPDLPVLARALDAAEVAALAIAVDERDELARFAEAAAAVAVPVLRADLLLEEFQIYESRAAGADAVLLFASHLPGDLLRRLCDAARGTHMAACVACANAAEVQRAAEARAQIIALAPGDVGKLAVPARTLVLALSHDGGLRGKADAALDAELAKDTDPAQAFAAALAKDA